MVTCAPRQSAQTAGLEHLCLPNDDDKDEDDGSEDACELSIYASGSIHTVRTAKCGGESVQIWKTPP